MNFIKEGKTNWKFLSIVIILAIIVGVGALWCAKRPEKPYQPVEIKKSETADWKTYKNEQYGFEFKYPKDWVNTVICGRYGDCEGTFCFRPGKDTCPKVYNISEKYEKFFDIEIYPIKSFDEYMKDVRNLFHRTDFPATFNNQLISEKELTIGGTRAVERTIQYSNEETAAPSFNWIGKKMVEVHIPLGTDNIIEFDGPYTEINIFNQILSTFRFLK